jgi:hypothetical protein
MRRHWGAAPIAGAASRAAVSIACVRWRRRPWIRRPATATAVLLPDWRTPSCACRTCLRGDGGGGGELKITGRCDCTALPGRRCRCRCRCVVWNVSRVKVSCVVTYARRGEQQRARRACAQADEVARQQSRGREGAQISVGLAESLAAGPGEGRLFTVAGRMRPRGSSLGARISTRALHRPRRQSSQTAGLQRFAASAETSSNRTPSRLIHSSAFATRCTCSPLLVPRSCCAVETIHDKLTSKPASFRWRNAQAPMSASSHSANVTTSRQSHSVH